MCSVATTKKRYWGYTINGQHCPHAEFDTIEELKQWAERTKNERHIYFIRDFKEEKWV